MCEIADLARTYLEHPEVDGIGEIDSNILKATDESRWDDVGKWHRVRLRLLRFRHERMATVRRIMAREPRA